MVWERFAGHLVISRSSQIYTSYFAGISLRTGGVHWVSKMLIEPFGHCSCKINLSSPHLNCPQHTILHLLAPVSAGSISGGHSEPLAMCTAGSDTNDIHNIYNTMAVKVVYCEIHHCKCLMRFGRLIIQEMSQSVSPQ